MRERDHALNLFKASHEPLESGKTKAMTPLRLLIIDNSPDQADALVAELRRGGYQVSATRVNTAKAMKRALEEQPWEVIVAEHTLPRFDAFSALEILRALQLDLPFILVSKAIKVELGIALMKAGAHDYVVKGEWTRLVPVMARELRAAAERQEHREAQAELRQQTHNVGKLARSIAHELNNVLAPIFMSAQLLQDNIEDESRRTILTTLEESARRAASITQQLQTLGRSITGYEPGSDETESGRRLLRSREALPRVSSGLLG
jgi:DNA-binding response OmpR family regulator